MTTTIFDPMTNSYTLSSYQSPVNVFNESNGQWQAIEYKFYQLDGSDTAYQYGYRAGTRTGVFDVYFKRQITDTWPFVLTYQTPNTNLYALRQQIVACGYVDKNNFEYVILQEAQDSQGIIVDDTTIMYADVFMGTTITWDYTEAGIKENITLSNTTRTAMEDNPPSSFGLSNADSWFVMVSELDIAGYDIESNGTTVSMNTTITHSIDFKDVVGMTRFSLPIGSACDVHGNDRVVNSKVVFKNERMYLVYGIPVSWLNTATFPVTIDPSVDVFAETTDGYVIRQGTSDWAATRGHTDGTGSNAAGNYDTTTNSADWIGSYYQIERGFFMFNTSAIDDNATVTSASLFIYGYSNGGINVCAQMGTQGDTITIADYDAFTGSEYGHTSGWTTLGYNEIYFNAQGKSDINVTGITYICTREYDHDYLNAAPGTTYRGGCYFADSTGTTRDPYLNITYTLGAAPGQAPAQSGASPTNGAMNVNLTPTLAIGLSDGNGDAMNYTFRTNASGPWAMICSANSVANGTYTCTATDDMDELLTEYYWSVNVTDGTNWTNATYHFTSRGNDNPILSSPSPANNSTGAMVNPSLAITVNDNNTDAMSIIISTNASNPSVWTTVASHFSKYNGTYYGYPSNMDDYNTTYWWKVVVNDTFNETVAIYHFTTMNESTGYTVYIRYETNETLVSLNASNLYNLTTYFEDDMIYKNVSTNPFSVEYDTMPLLMRLYVIEENFTYYRSLIPQARNGSITFRLPYSSDSLNSYTFELDDRTGLYSLQNASFRIYLKVNNSDVLINEDYWSANDQTNAYLIYQDKYYGEVISGLYVFTRWIDADLFATPYLKTITIYQLEMGEIDAAYDFMSLTLRLDNDSGVVYFAYDADSGTNWINVTIYRINETGVLILVWQGNYTSNSFTISLATNVSQMHVAYVNVSHDDIDESSDNRDWVDYAGNNLAFLRLRAFPIGWSPDWDTLNDKTDSVWGENPFGWISIGFGAFIIAFAFAFGPTLAPLGMVTSGGVILCFNMIFGIVFFPTILGVLLIFLGAAVIITQEGHL